MMYRFIYLAAGFSRRFGGNKLLADFEGRPLFTHLLGELVSLAGSGEVRADVTVVTQYEAVASWCEAAGEGRPGLIRAVKNPDPARGIASSLKCGLEAAAAVRPFENEDRLVFFVADQPYLKKAEVLAFLEACREAGAGLACCAARTSGSSIAQHPGDQSLDAPIAQPPGAPIAQSLDAPIAQRPNASIAQPTGDSLGNPCLFSPAYVPELMALTGDRGGKRVLRRHMEDAFIFRSLDPVSLWDIDTPPVTREGNMGHQSLQS